MIRMKREAGKSRRCPRNGKVWLVHAGPVVAIATVAIGNGKARQRKTKPGDRPVRYRLPGRRCAVYRGEAIWQTAGGLTGPFRCHPFSMAQAILFALLVAVAAFARLVSCCWSVCFMFKARQSLWLLVLASAAQADSLPVFQGDEVVVTATRQAQSVVKTLSDVSVITREDIDQSAATNLPQLLARVPGIEVVNSGNVGSQTSLYLRGSNANQTIVLLDGMRIVSATSGTTALENIPLDSIERIEVVRGSSSSLYGADAIGGVVQIFTRQGSGAPRFNAALGFGDHGLVKSSAGVSGKVDNTAFNVQINQEQTDGFSATNPQSSSYNADRDPYRNLSYNASLTQTIASGHDISLQLFQIMSKLDYDGYQSTGEDLQRSRQTGAALESKNRSTISGAAPCVTATPWTARNTGITVI
jgi:outer membrane receptor protein involved in Fe transport